MYVILLCRLVHYKILNSRLLNRLSLIIKHHTPLIYRDSRRDYNKRKPLTQGDFVYKIRYEQIELQAKRLFNKQLH